MEAVNPSALGVDPHIVVVTHQRGTHDVKVDGLLHLAVPTALIRCESTVHGRIPCSGERGNHDK